MKPTIDDVTGQSQALKRVNFQDEANIHYAVWKYASEKDTTG